MSNSLMGINREQLAKALGPDFKLIRAFEQLIDDSISTPTTVQEAAAVATAALAVAQAAVGALQVLEEFVSGLVPLPHQESAMDHEVHMPFDKGTLSYQNADDVDISGGLIDSTIIGSRKPAAASFTTVSASDVITSTVADGRAPIVVASKTLVANLYVERAKKADTATAASKADMLTNPTSFPPDATDPASTQTLVNALKAAAINKGL